MSAGRRALVTGGSGFVGQWLIRALLERGYAVTAVSHEEHAGARILTSDERAATAWRVADVRDEASLRAALAASRPDALFHLAGIAFVPDAQKAPLAAYEVNGLGVARLLAALHPLRAAGELDPAVVVVGSGEEYGRHDGGAPLAETDPLRPLTVYAASKVVQETIALQAHRGEGVRVVCTRSFNHSGPGQSDRFLLPALARRVLALRRAGGGGGGGGGTLALGNTTPVRDYLHVADVVDAYCRLAEAGEPGEAYNVSSGEGISVAELARAVLQRAGLSADISTDPSLVRPVDLPVLVGSSAKLRRRTGWAPRHTREAMIDDLLRSVSDDHAAPH